MEFCLACIEVVRKVEEEMSREQLALFEKQDFFDPFSDHYVVAAWIQEHCLTDNPSLCNIFHSLGITDKDDMCPFLLEFLWLYLRLKCANRL